MKSMTGYAKSIVSQDNLKLEIEIKSINGRYFDLKMYVPRDISFLENLIRTKLNEALSRGSIEIRINLNDHREPKIKLNTAKLVMFNEIVKQAQIELNTTYETPLVFLLGEPGVVEISNEYDNDPVLLELMNSALDQVLEQLLISLHQEGKQMKDYLSKSAELIGNTIPMIENEIGPYKESILSNMKERIVNLLQNNTNDNLEQRITQELAMLIDKYDVHEEVSRLKSHLSTFLSTLDNEDDCGKSLNFILQEMQRESNTLGSKFSTEKTFRYILILKEEIEKCREIIQNVA